MKNMKVLVAVVAVSLSGIAHAEGRERREMPAEVKEAFTACGVTVTEGQRPEINDEQRTCLEAKGIKGRGGPGGPGGHHGNFEKMKQCLEAKGITLPKPERGQRPQLDDAARAAMKACRDEAESASVSEGQEAAEPVNESTVSSAI
jgi:hypothetical protein